MILSNKFKFEWEMNKLNWIFAEYYYEFGIVYKWESLVLKPKPIEVGAFQIRFYSIHVCIRKLFAKLFEKNESFLYYWLELDLSGHSLVTTGQGVVFCLKKRKDFIMWIWVLCLMFWISSDFAKRKFNVCNKISD